MNEYRRMDDDELRMMLSKGMSDDEYNSWIKAFCERKFNSDFSREMNRSVEEYLKQYRR